MHVGELSFGHVFRSRHNHPTLNIAALACHLLDQRPKVGVDKDKLIVGVINNVNDLLREQSWVNRMANIP